MNRTETLQFIGMIRSSFPTWNRNITQQELNAIAFTWHIHFGDVPSEQMMWALLLYQKHHTFPPTIADIESSLKTIMNIANTKQINGDKSEHLMNIIKALNNHLYKRDDVALLEASQNTSEFFITGEPE